MGQILRELGGALVRWEGFILIKNGLTLGGVV